MEEGDEDQVEWFGQPDGTMGEFDGGSTEFITIPSRFGGIGRDPSDAKVRIVAGALGAGKSLLLRRMHAHQSKKNTGATYAVPVYQMGSDLSTDDIALFAERQNRRDANTEMWKLLWLRAILRSTASTIRFTPALRDACDPDVLDEINGFGELLGSPRAPRSIPNEARSIIHLQSGRERTARYLKDDRWADVEYFIGQALQDLPPLFLYVDDIDKNYRWAPTLWAQCQRGLFYEIMDLIRNPNLGGRLHIIAAIRDVTMATIRASEHAPRYLDKTHINQLNWDRESVSFFLEGKLERLPDKFFSDPRSKSVDSWLGISTIAPDRRPRAVEPVQDYLLRHTRLVPRDIVILGNKLCSAMERAGYSQLSNDELKRVVKQVSYSLVDSQLALCVNQVMSDLLVPGAVEKEYDHVYLHPNDYALNDSKLKIIECIDASGTETFDEAVLDGIDEMARHKFGNDEFRLSNVLWQQKLLGRVTEDRDQSFFDGNAAVTSPSIRTSARNQQFVWNPMIFDIASGVASTLTTPMWPMK